MSNKKLERPVSAPVFKSISDFPSNRSKFFHPCPSEQNSSRKKFSFQKDMQPILNEANASLLQGKISYSMFKYQKSVFYLLFKKISALISLLIQFILFNIVLDLSKEIHGEQTFKNLFETIVSFLLKIGLRLLSSGENENAFIIFSSIEALTKLGRYGRFIEIRVMALNTIGYYYQKINLYGVAIEQFKKALNYLEQYRNTKKRSQTHMNLSTLYFQLEG